VEGLRGNAPYLETIIPFSNILCLQEHWLWQYGALPRRPSTLNEESLILINHISLLSISIRPLSKTEHCGLSAMLTDLLSGSTYSMEI
jgi:hypothetical protein